MNDEEMYYEDHTVQNEPLESNYAIEIRKVNNGFIVAVGCKTFVFEERQRMQHYIDLYLTDPIGTEKAFRKGELFNK